MPPEQYFISSDQHLINIKFSHLHIIDIASLPPGE